MMNKLTICMDHPPKELSANASRAYTARGARIQNIIKGEIKSAMRRKAWVVTKAELGLRDFVPTHYVIVWYYNRGVKPDADNVVARCKAVLDGACDALCINDRDLELGGVQRLKDKDRAGTVEVLFERRGSI